MTIIEEQYANALLKQKMKKKKNWKIIRILILLTILIGASLYIVRDVISIYVIPSNSMYPTLAAGDKILVNRLFPEQYPLKSGDIIVFEDPGSWLPPNEQKISNILIKRIVAIGGDTIECCSDDGSIILNGAIMLEPYIDIDDGPSDKTFKETVPEGYVFVMGDNRSDSNDSRYQTEQTGGKFVPIEKIKGKAFWLISPKWGEVK